MRFADAELAARDPALPGLPVLLDDAVLTRWLTERGLGPARRRYLRYKPGTNCLLGLDLVEDGGPRSAVLTTWAPGRSRKLDRARAAAPPGAVLAADEERGLLLTAPCADLRLPAVAALTHDLRVLAGLLPGVDLTAAHLTPLRHKPARRWVARLAGPGLEPVLLRAHRPEVSAELHAALAALGTPAVRTPRLLGGDPALGLSVLEWLPGRALPDVDPAEAPAHLRATGRALARLHQHPAPDLRHRGRDELLAAVRSAAVQVGALLPAEAARAAELAGRVATRLRGPADLRVCHGDFSADQVVVGPGGPALADLDEVALDDPAVDLASATAAARLDGGRAGGPEDAAAVLGGYATVRSLPPARLLAAHTAAALLRRAPEPFRLAAPSWPDGVRAALAAAEDELS